MYFKKDILQTDLQGKQKIHSQSISHYNELRMVENTLRI